MMTPAQTAPELKIGGMEVKIAGVCPVRDPDPNGPNFDVILHRDVGGPQLRDKHRLNDPNCWCAPLRVNPDLDPRREVYQQQFAGLKRLN